MMEKEYIQKLLASYMAAETTKEEEKLLSDYFSTHRDIPAEWRNYSVMFRSIRQYKQKPDASHKRAILKWSAAAAVIAFIFGAGLLLMRQEELCKPSDAISQITESPTINVWSSESHQARLDGRVVTDKDENNVIELKQEITVEEAPVMTQPQARQNIRKRHVRRIQKAVAQVNQPEPLPDVSLSAHNLIPAEEPARSLSSHRDGMRKNIWATFENSNIFIAENTVEL